MDKIFDGCKSLIFIPDISQWNLKKYLKGNISIPFKCTSLSYLPDFYFWRNRNNRRLKILNNINLIP